MMPTKIQSHHFIGWDIQQAIAEAIKMARRQHDALSFDFNGVAVTVTARSNADLIYRDWSRAMDGKIAKAVGPHPVAELTDENRANDARVDAANKARREAQEADYRRRAEEDRQVHAVAMASAPAMERDEGKWAEGIAAQKGEGYGLAIYQFAEDWARLMQARIASGENLTDIADECCTLADKAHGITGFMYGAAVHVLAQCWTHGDTLRRWHNAKYGRTETDGTVNPAVLTLA